MSSSEICDCKTEESSSLNKDSNCEINSKKKEPELKCTLFKLELNKDALNSIISQESSTCDQTNLTNKAEKSDSCTCTSEEKDSSRSCSCSSEHNNSLKSYDYTSEESLKTCTCSESCDSYVFEPIIASSECEILEHTLAIIKPEAMMFRNEIEREIIDEGFKICQRRWLRLTPEQVSDFYCDNYKKKYFAHLITYMSSDPILVFILSKCNAIKAWKILMGPTKITNARVYAPDSIRGKYGRKGDDMKNAVHGSESQKDAEREINFFFPDRTKEPMLNEEDAVEYLKKHINETLSKGLVKCCEEKPNDPIVWLGNWLLENNPKRPKYLLLYKSNLYD